MSLGRRDQAALALVRKRRFAGTFLKSFELELQTRRLTLALYGALSGRAGETALATITFFGAGELKIDNDDGAFPDSVELANVEFSDYEEISERGSANITGRAAWTMSWTYDGLAYEDVPATVASLVDES
jgi:hypothetical protein